jgi:hypothetical protein
MVLSIIFYVATLFATALYAFGIRRSDVFEPIGLYLFFVSLFTLPLPIRTCFTLAIEGNVSQQLMQFYPYIPLSVFMVAVSMPMFAAGYYSRVSARIGLRLPMLADRGKEGVRAGIGALVFLSALLIYLLTQELGGLIPFLLLGYKSSEATFGKGYFAVGFPWLIVANVALIDRWAITRSKLDLVFAFALFCANLAMHLVTGNRGLLMYLLIVVIIFIHFRIKPLSLKLLAPVALVGFVALNVVGSLRNSDYESLEDFAEKTSRSAETVGSGESEGLFYTLTIGEFVVPFETLPQMVRTVGVTEMPWLGWSFLRAPIYLIPSFAIPDRPDSLGFWYMENFYGGGFGLNEGRAFFFLAEAYLNFGPFGILLLAWVWGVLWSALHRWMMAGRERFGTVMIYALAVAFMFRSIAGELATLLVGTTQQSLAAVVIVVFVAGVVRRLSPRRRSKVGLNRQAAS